MGKNLTIASVLALMPTMGLAEAPHWTLKPESTIEWEAVQNGAAVTGGFETFAGDIAFDPEHPETSKVSLTISTGSVKTSYAEAQSTLTTADWFASEAFPDAVFESGSISRINGSSQYEGTGTLTIKQKQVPVSYRFEWLTEQDVATAKGELSVKRTDFGIGWADTSGVADDVKIRFNMVAVPKP